jgi:hypothetical protein
MQKINSKLAIDEKKVRIKVFLLEASERNNGRLIPRDSIMQMRVTKTPF